MANQQNVIRWWGIIDFAFIVFYLAMAATKGHIPIYHEIKQALQTSSSFGNYFPIQNSSSFGSIFPLIVTVLGLVLYVSIIFSGMFLFQLRKTGAFIVYIQTPFRLALLIPSLFFILWPLPYLFGKTSLALGVGIVLVLASESFKLVTVISWHKSFKNAV